MIWMAGVIACDVYDRSNKTHPLGLSHVAEGIYLCD